MVSKIRYAVAFGLWLGHIPTYEAVNEPDGEQYVSVRVPVLLYSFILVVLLWLV